MLSWIIWDYSPIAFSIFNREIRWYGLLLATGFYLGYYILQKIMKKADFSEDKTNILSVYLFLGTVIGLRLGHCFFYEPGYYLSHPLDIFKVWEGGLASHGGGLGIFIAVWLFGKKYKYSMLEIFDKIVIIIPLVAALVRIGNLMNSEIYGTFTNAPWAFTFTRIQDSALLPRHPTQIYEALVYFMIFGLLMFLYFKKNYSVKVGYLMGLFLVLVFTSRFLIEFIKDVQVEWEKNLPLDMGQMLSIPFIIAGIILIRNACKKDNDAALESTKKEKQA